MKPYVRATFDNDHFHITGHFNEPELGCLIMGMVEQSEIKPVIIATILDEYPEELEKAIRLMHLSKSLEKTT